MNDNDFNFCRRCGFHNEAIIIDKSRAKRHIDLPAINLRLEHLRKKKSNKSYERQKSALHSLLSHFLSSLPVPKTLASASPADVITFLVWKDKAGKTVVHESACPGLGQRLSKSCDCPTRLAAGTVDSLIGKICAIFIQEGLGGDWDDRLGIGNPASHPSVKGYVKNIKEEQALARIQPQKAVPLFEDKLISIAKHIFSKLRQPNVPPHLLCVLARDLAFFCVDFYAGDRSLDLGRAKSKEVLYFPEFAGLLFSHSFGKTVRDGSTHSFCVRPCCHSDICPVSSFKLYLDICNFIKIDISSGFLFRSITRNNRISEEPFAGSAPYNRLKGHLRDLGINDGETPHSLRSECSITLQLLGVSKQDTARHVGWRTLAMVDHYNCLDQTLQDSSPASVLAAGKLPAGGKSSEENIAKYRQLNTLSGFHPVFL